MFSKAGVPPDGIARLSAADYNTDDIVPSGSVSGASIQYSPGYPCKNPLLNLMKKVTASIAINNFHLLYCCVLLASLLVELFVGNCEIRC